jgi:hypothetical protein
MNESDTNTSDGKSKTMAAANAVGLHYASNGFLIGMFLGNPITGIVGGALGYALGMLTVFAKANSNGGE